MRTADDVTVVGVAKVLKSLTTLTTSWSFIMSFNREQAFTEDSGHEGDDDEVIFLDMEMEDDETRDAVYKMLGSSCSMFKPPGKLQHSEISPEASQSSLFANPSPEKKICTEVTDAHLCDYLSDQLDNARRSNIKLLHKNRVLTEKLTQLKDLLLNA